MTNTMVRMATNCEPQPASSGYIEMQWIRMKHDDFTAGTIHIIGWVLLSVHHFLYIEQVLMGGDDATSR
jgi:hypothetical protein